MLVIATALNLIDREVAGSFFCKPSAYVSEWQEAVTLAGALVGLSPRCGGYVTLCQHTPTRIQQKYFDIVVIHSDKMVGDGQILCVHVKINVV